MIYDKLLLKERRPLTHVQRNERMWLLAPTIYLSPQNAFCVFLSFANVNYWTRVIARFTVNLLANTAKNLYNIPLISYWTLKELCEWVLVCTYKKSQCFLLQQRQPVKIKRVIHQNVISPVLVEQKNNIVLKRRTCEDVECPYTCLFTECSVSQQPAYR